MPRLFFTGAFFALALALASCSPKPDSDPTTFFFVGSQDGDAQTALDFTDGFAVEEGFRLLGSREDLRADADHAHQFYRLDAQIIATQGHRPGELIVAFYRSGGPITMSADDVSALAARYQLALSANPSFVIREEP